MFKRTILMAALAVAFGTPLSASAADASDLAQIRAEIRQMKESYEARIQALEKRLQDAQTKAEPQAQTQTQEQEPAQSAAAPEPRVAAASAANQYNPTVSLILGGTYANLSQDPTRYRLQGFIPGGEIGPGSRSFNLGESELTMSANVDHLFAGRLTFSLAGDNTASVEEAFLTTHALSNGVNLKAGRFLSSLGYLNEQHAHAWDFVDAPLIYQAFLGGQYKTDGLQMRWLAPTDRFFELGMEAGAGGNFPSNASNKNGFGSTTLFAHLGDDIGTGGSWRAGLSYLHTSAADRPYDDVDALGVPVTNAFTGRSHMWMADGIYKWSPEGNSVQTNFKLQGEYFRRSENGSLTYDTQAQSLGTASGNYASAQSGWYLQSVYQFEPTWRVGLRYDKLYAGTPEIGLVNNGLLSAANFSRLASYNPSRSTVMLDYSPSEFSRFRLQYAHDKSRPEASDNQLFFQYIMSLGAHGAHSF
jgi:hypothetical protein